MTLEDERVRLTARIDSFEALDKSRASVTIFYNFRHLIVSLFAAPTPEGQPLTAAPIENQLIHALQVYLADKRQNEGTYEEYDPDGDWEDGWAKHYAFTMRAQKTILRLGRFAFAQSAPPVVTRPDGLTLQDLLYPIEVHFRIQTVNGKVQISKIRPDQAASLPSARHEPQVCPTFKPDPDLPLFSAAEIQVHRVASYCGAVCKAMLNGEICVAKTHMLQYFCPRIYTEMTKLRQIGKAEERFDIHLRTSKLLAYITEEETGAIIGYVGEWIESSRLGTTLDDVRIAKMPLSKRRKWADQIEETMKDLHALNLVWGDCKPAHVIIDEDEDAWLIDLGNSFTDAWVDPKLEGTLEGDAMGLSRIQKWLGVV
ncbi:hypothetical protein NLG97_g6705 [Lecanicillium saksenae]|uniref:Uncharacterized protein n=1 Tax=Lecanicillium saksenae TaxID=468837 RepID=A0ACC1QPG1_9HYPO|nr:hypothetical protein NLG97_g6705 [Lecanicillium saksenae]